jgi:hypothetical protein
MRLNCPSNVISGRWHSTKRGTADLLAASNAVSKGDPLFSFVMADFYSHNNSADTPEP